MSVSVEIRHPTRRVDTRQLTAHVEAMLADAGRADAWVDVSLVTDVEIAELNGAWRGESGVTDVLSFALAEAEVPPGGPDMLGDVVVSLDTAARQAALVRQVHGLSARVWRLRDEVRYLLTHGVLHLLGWDHATPREAELMAAEERRLLADLRAVPFQRVDRSGHALGAG